MARYDKYDPISGGFRAKLAADWAKADEGIPFAVSLDGNGRVVKGTAGQSGLAGVLVVDRTGLAGSTVKAKLAGDVVDVMTAGEIVEVTSPVLAAGTAIFTNAAGALSAGVSTNLAVGHTVEADRLVVRVTKGAKP